MSHTIAHTAKVVLFPDGRVGALLRGVSSNTSPRTPIPGFCCLSHSEGTTRALLLCEQLHGTIHFKGELANVNAYPLAELSAEEQTYIDKTVPHEPISTPEIARRVSHMFDSHHLDEPERLSFLHQTVEALLEGRIARVPTEELAAALASR